jgi:hypothetical protein
VSILSTYLCLPREVHLEAVFHVCAYIGLHHNTRVVFDPTYPSVDMGTFIKTDWKSMYGDMKEMIPSYAPIPCVKEVDLRLFVYSDHAGEKITMHSRTGFVIYLNMAPIVWFSKRQPVVDSSVFGADFVAMKNGIETCCGLCYRLIFMGVTLSGPTFLYLDNMYVVHNTAACVCLEEEVKLNLLPCGTRVGESIIGHMPSVNNPADICTKFVPGGQKRNHLIHLLLHDLCDYLIILLSKKTFGNFLDYVVNPNPKIIIKEYHSECFQNEFSLDSLFQFPSLYHGEKMWNILLSELVHATK